MKSAQLSAMRCLAANDYYDYFIIAGNSDEAVEKKDVRHPVSVFMLSVKPCFVAHKFFLEKAKEKQATLAAVGTSCIQIWFF